MTVQNNELIVLVLLPLQSSDERFERGVESGLAHECSSSIPFTHGLSSISIPTTKQVRVGDVIVLQEAGEQFIVRPRTEANGTLAEVTLDFLLLIYPERRR